MADSAVVEDAAAIPAAGAPRGGGKRKLILFVAAPVLLLLAVGAGLYLMGFFGSHAAATEAANGKEAEKGKDKEGKPPAFFEVPEMLVNINSGGKRTGFLKISISLELDDPASLPQVQALLPRIRDNFQTYLRELRVEDLKGSAGLYRLREELLLRVNAAVAPAKVNDVLFNEMLVQ